MKAREGQYKGIERRLFSEFYSAFTKYAYCLQDDLDWEICVNEISQLTKKYNDYPMARQMAELVMKQLEFIHTREISNGTLSNADWNDIFVKNGLLNINDVKVL